MMLKSSMLKAIKILTALAFILIFISSSSSAKAGIFQSLQWPFYDPNGTDSPTSCSTTTTSGGSNLDYAGRPILNQGNLDSVSRNRSTYEQAAQQVGIPWQTLAALHYRENNLSTSEPSTKPVAVGVYQITYNDSNRQKYNLDGPNYPAGGQVLTPQQFLNQSIDAANFLKSDGAGLSSNSDSGTIKDAFAKYNGLPQKYVDQAVALGFPSTQGYEGSPYVMNFADARRDPGVAAAGTWLQDAGGGNYVPANNQYGAYLVYASLSGAGINGGCITAGCTGQTNLPAGLSPVRQSIVCIAEQELQKWTNGQLQSGSGYKTYSEGRDENWCADFVSWVYNQANHPLGPGGSPTSNWNVSYVPNLLVPPQDGTKFQVHPVSGYTPQPGDLAIHGDHHVNIVASVSGSQIYVIGGNQGANDQNQSKVTKYGPIDFSDGGEITNYVSPE